jgi:glutathione peroxidase
MINIAFSLISFLLTSFYSLQFQDVNGSTINMSSFQGKKVLLVNIASNSSLVSQIGQLQQLKQQFGDSLVVIAFPSNSFGSEPKTNAEIKQFCETTYNSTFIIASKGSVSGSGLLPVYDWLSKATDNGDADIIIGGDFQKILIAKDGSIQGTFSPKLNPLHPSIIQAINTNY